MTGGRYRTGRKSPTWHKQAECRNYQSVDWWFSETPEHIVKATTICRRCPVAQECANTAIENVETFGIWGGLTPEQLAQKQDRQATGPKATGGAAPCWVPKTEPAQCGTESGYHRHRNANEQPCFAVFGRPRRRHPPPLLRTQSPPITQTAPEPQYKHQHRRNGIHPGSSPGAARHKPNTGQRHNQTKEQTQWKKSFSIAARQPGRHPSNFPPSETKSS